MTASLSAFVAYPVEPAMIAEAILAASEESASAGLRLTPWQKLSIVGLRIDDLIREKISTCDLLLADITYPNFNVLYEMGYAAASGKTVVPIVNGSIAGGGKAVREIGLFDTIGYLEYRNSLELLERLRGLPEASWADGVRRDKDHAQPLFILDSYIKTNYRNYIYSSVANSQVKSRSFDPVEIPRLTAHHAVQEISASSGVILTLLKDDIKNALENNLRAAFLAGLAHGYEIETLILQFDGGPAPFDYRDLVRNAASRTETERHVSEYCAEVLIRNQQSSRHSRKYSLGLLNKIDLGSSTAEMETQYLSDYFIQTAEYSRAIRAQGAIVIGRKGSGKTAIAIRAGSEAARDVNKIVLDLRPAAHNLSDLREQLLGSVGQGLFDHTIAAFWQYVVLLEILLAVRERALKRAKREYSLQEEIGRIESRFNLTEDFLSGDFTSRLDATVGSVLQFLHDDPAPDDVRMQITNVMFENLIPELRNSIFFP